MELKPFDIILFKGTGLLSRIIKASTRSEYSHSALVLDGFHVVETDFKQPLAINHFTYRLGQFDAYRLKVPLSQEQQEQILKFIQKTLNSKYDTFEAVSVLTFKYFGITFDAQNKFICSGWVNEAFQRAGVLLVPGTRLVTPADISGSQFLFKVNGGESTIAGDPQSIEHHTKR